MKLAIVGPGRVGKDVVAGWIHENTRLDFSLSTSQVICPYVAAQLGITPDEAFARRHEDRDLWYRVGNVLRRDDPAFLARRTLVGGDLCVGIRSRGEMMAVRYEPLVDLVIWVARDVPHDPTLEFNESLADVIIDNNATLPELFARLRRLSKALGILR